MDGLRKPRAFYAVVLAVLLVGGLTLLVAGCNRGSMATPSETPTLAPMATSTATPLPSATPNRTPAATATTATTPAPTVTATPTPTPTAMPTPTPAPPLAGVPRPTKRDLYELARALSLKTARPIQGFDYTQPPLRLESGHNETFTIMVQVDVKSEVIKAKLELVSEHAYWYFQEGVTVDRARLEQSAKEFEEKVYPMVTKTFGPLWPENAAPGHRVVILHAKLRGVGGYYSSSDEYPKSVHLLSNEKKMIYISVTALGVGSPEYMATLAHELQHASQWNINGGQETWLNEGLSQVAELLYGRVPFTVGAFLGSQPVSLVHWPLSITNSSANYGAAFLFSEFLRGQHARDNDLTMLGEVEEAGIYAVEEYLKKIGSKEDFDGLFSRWVAANYMGESKAGPLGYDNLKIAATPTNNLSSGEKATLAQPQYSARYIKLNVKEPSVVRFNGEASSQLMPVEPLDGGKCWWSNRGDSISTTLTREIDLTAAQRATLELRLWYDIEQDWDYGYVLVSTDGGVTWDILKGRLAVEQNPVGNGFGPGYSGASQSWAVDSIDLSAYAGKKALLRLNYVTDDATGGAGFCVDNVSIPEIKLLDDTSSAGGWTPEGFYLTDNRFEQGYAVWLVETRGGVKSAKRVELDKGNDGSVEIKDVAGLEEAVLVVGSMSRHSSQAARYTVEMGKGS